MLVPNSQHGGKNGSAPRVQSSSSCYWAAYCWNPISMPFLDSSSSFTPRRRPSATLITRYCLLVMATASSYCLSSLPRPCSRGFPGLVPSVKCARACLGPRYKDKVRARHPLTLAALTRRGTAPPLLHDNNNGHPARDVARAVPAGALYIPAARFLASSSLRHEGEVPRAEFN